MKVGRPSDYTEEKANVICQKLVEGISLNRITSDSDMPSIATVYAWFKRYPKFLKKYEIAKDDQIDTLADELLDIADNVDNRTESVQRDRLRVDTRKWIAERMKPKKYGVKAELNQSMITYTKMPTVTKDGKELEFDIGG
jgi:hypothetical protein